MRRPVFWPVPLRDHLVVGEQCRIEQHHVAPAEPRLHGRGHGSTAGDEGKARVPVAERHADIGRRLGVGHRIIAFAIERRLARNGEQATPRSRPAR